MRLMFFKCIKLLLFLGSLVVVCLGCKSEKQQLSDYVKTVQSGFIVLPWPAQMEAMFGDADHFITHYGFSSEPKTWNSEVCFGGRYILTMQVEVTVNYRKNKVDEINSTPSFSLRELEVIRPGINAGEGSGASIANQWKFGQDEWKKLVESHGHWRVLNIPVNTNNPLPNFDVFVADLRNPRVKIPH